MEVEDDTRALRGVSAGTLERTASFSRSLFMNLSLLAKNLTGLTSMEPRELDAQTTLEQTIDDEVGFRRSFVLAAGGRHDTHAPGWAPVLISCLFLG